MLYNNSMKQKNYNKTRHSVYRLTYHLVLVTKYRKNIITDEVANTIKVTIERFYKDYNLKVIEYNYEGNHLHLLFSIHPNANIQKIVNAMKSATSRVVRNTYPGIRKNLYKNAFWSRGYYIAATGNVRTQIV